MNSIARIACMGSLLIFNACGYAAAAPKGSDQDAGYAAYLAKMTADQQEHPTLKVGAQAPDFALKGTDGKLHKLADYNSSPILAIVFISNHCPASQLYEGRIKALIRDYASKGLTLVAIAPNGPDAASPSELNYTDVDDSFESMKIRAEYRICTMATRSRWRTSTVPRSLPTSSSSMRNASFGSRGASMTSCARPRRAGTRRAMRWMP